jgi:multidrug efflux pump subunit AcrA (membrane-fusion protein)
MIKQIKHQSRKQRSLIVTSDKLLPNFLTKSLNRTLAVIGLLLVSCSPNAPQSGGEMVVPVPIASVESAIVTDSSDYVANLQSRQSVTLQPRVDGYVQEIYVKAGDRVEAGAPILRIDPTKQQAVVQRSVAAVATTQSDLESAKATLAQLRAQKESTLSNVDFSQKEYERFAKLKFPTICEVPKPI